MSIKQRLVPEHYKYEIHQTNVYLHKCFCPFGLNIVDSRAEVKCSTYTIKPILVSISMWAIKSLLAQNTDRFLYSVEMYWI